MSQSAHSIAGILPRVALSPVPLSSVPPEEVSQFRFVKASRKPLKFNSLKIGKPPLVLGAGKPGDVWGFPSASIAHVEEKDDWFVYPPKRLQPLGLPVTPGVISFEGLWDAKAISILHPPPTTITATEATPSPHTLASHDFPVSMAPPLPVFSASSPNVVRAAPALVSPSPQPALATHTNTRALSALSIADTPAPALTSASVSALATAPATPSPAGLTITTASVSTPLSLITHHPSLPEVALPSPSSPSDATPAQLSSPSASLTSLRNAMPSLDSMLAAPAPSPFVGRDHQRYLSDTRLVVGCVSVCVPFEAVLLQCFADGSVAVTPLAHAHTHARDTANTSANADASTNPTATAAPSLVYSRALLVPHPLFLTVAAAKATDWILPKGGWEVFEGAEEAAARETVEEAGVSGPLLPPTWYALDPLGADAVSAHIDTNDTNADANTAAGATAEHDGPAAVATATTTATAAGPATATRDAAPWWCGCGDAHNTHGVATQHAAPNVHPHARAHGYIDAGAGGASGKLSDEAAGTPLGPTMSASSCAAEWRWLWTSDGAATHEGHVCTARLPPPPPLSSSTASAEVVYTRAHHEHTPLSTTTISTTTTVATSVATSQSSSSTSPATSSPLRPAATPLGCVQYLPPARVLNECHMYLQLARRVHADYAESGRARRWLTLEECSGGVQRVHVLGLVRKAAEGLQGWLVGEGVGFGLRVLQRVGLRAMGICVDEHAGSAETLSPVMARTSTDAGKRKRVDSSEEAREGAVEEIRRSSVVAEHAAQTQTRTPMHIYEWLSLPSTSAFEKRLKFAMLAYARALTAQRMDALADSQAALAVAKFGRADCLEMRVFSRDIAEVTALSGGIAAPPETLPFGVTPLVRSGL